MSDIPTCRKPLPGPTTYMYTFILKALSVCVLGMLYILNIIMCTPLKCVPIAVIVAHSVEYSVHTVAIQVCYCNVRYRARPYVGSVTYMEWYCSDYCTYSETLLIRHLYNPTFSPIQPLYEVQSPYLSMVSGTP